MYKMINFSQPNLVTVHFNSSNVDVSTSTNPGIAVLQRQSRKNAKKLKCQENNNTEKDSISAIR